MRRKATGDGRRETLILASGPVLGAGVGALTNLITATWNWWFFAALIILVSVAAVTTVIASRHVKETSPTGNDDGACTLPTRNAVFVGRTKESARLAERVRPVAGRPAVYLVTGKPGSGKTELVVQVAYRLRSRYPDGQLFLSFRSHSGEASQADAHDILIDALDTLSADSAHNNLNASQLSARWRSITANSRLLLILDDVISTSQIFPVMSNSQDSAMIITSRESIAGIDPDIHVNLSGLRPEESEEMITEITRRASVPIQPDLARSLAQVHHLPLSVRHVADQLVATAAGLGQHIRQPALGVTQDPAEVFRETINSLTTEDLLVFRRSALYPGLHVTPLAVSALADLELRDAEARVAAMEKRGLIIEVDTYGYAFHDVIRALALEESRTSDTEAEREAARDRLFRLFDRILAELNSSIGGPQHARAAEDGAASILGAMSEYEALEWLGNYFEDLRAVIRLAIDHEWPRTWRLTQGLAYYMRVRRNIPQAIELTESALQIALTRNEEAGQAFSYFQIGVLQRVLGNYSVAQEYVLRGLAIFRLRNDVLGQSRCFGELGHISQQMTHYTDSLEYTERALRLYAELGDVPGIANSEGILGMINRLIGDYRSATPHLNQALALYEQSGSMRNQGWILIELGTIDRQKGALEQASERFERARTFFHEAGDRNGYAWAGRELGIVARMNGDYDAAKILLSEALEIFTTAGSKRNVGDACVELSVVYREISELVKAREYAARALAIYEEIGNKRGAAWTELELGSIERLQGHSARALQRFEKALAAYQQIGDRSGLARTYSELGIEAARSKKPALARELINRAVELYTDMGSPLASTMSVELQALG